MQFVQRSDTCVVQEGWSTASTVITYKDYERRVLFVCANVSKKILLSGFARSIKGFLRSTRKQHAEHHEAPYLRMEVSMATICSTLKYPRLSSIMEVMLMRPVSYSLIARKRLVMAAN